MLNFRFKKISTSIIRGDFIKLFSELDILFEKKMMVLRNEIF